MVALASPAPVKLDPVSLILNASGPVKLVVWLLIAASLLVWVIAILKSLQVNRLRSKNLRFEEEARHVGLAGDLFALAKQHEDAPGARVVLELARRGAQGKLLDSVAKRAIVEQQQRASTLMPTLSSIAAASPFVGLFGTVYGIMDAFLRIGQEKSASLPVVAPAIGEALIATAIGLAAAIPAVVFYNAIDKRIQDLLGELEASAEGWIEIVNTGQGESLARTVPQVTKPPAVAATVG